MSSQHSHEQLIDLLAPYAINAVDDGERAAVEAFLEANTAYRAEVDEYRKAAALLATGHLNAPSELWERIQSNIEPAAPPLRLVEEPRSSRFAVLRLKRIAMVMSTAAAVLALALATVLVQNTREDPMSQLAVEAKAAPGTQSVTMESADHAQSALFVMTKDGHGYLENHNLPDLEKGQTYQLWAFVASGEPVSVAVLGQSIDETAFTAAARISSVAITVEPSGGSVAPTNLPLVSAALA